MPRVPYTSPVVGVDANPLPFSGGGEAPRLGPQGGAESMLMAADAIGTFTRGIEREQYRVERAQDRADALAERERIKQERLQDKVDDAAVADGELELLKVLREKSDPQKGFFALQGRAATEGFASYQQAIQDAIKEQSKRMSNDTQRKLFEHRAQLRALPALGQASEHAARQAAVWRAESQRSVAEESGALFVMQPLDTTPVGGDLAPDQQGPSPATSTRAAQNFGDALQSAYESKLNMTGDTGVAEVERRRVADALVAKASEALAKEGEYDKALEVVKLYGSHGNGTTMQTITADLTQGKAKKVERDTLTRDAFDLVGKAGANAIEQVDQELRDKKLTYEQYDFKRDRVRERLDTVERENVRLNNETAREGVASFMAAMAERSQALAQGRQPKAASFEDAVGPKFTARLSQLDPDRVAAMRQMWDNGTPTDTAWGLAQFRELTSNPAQLQGVAWADLEAKFFGNLTQQTLAQLQADWAFVNGKAAPGKAGEGAPIDNELGKLWYTKDANQFALVRAAMAAHDPLWAKVEKFTDIKPENLSRWKQQYMDAVMPALRNAWLKDPKQSIDNAMASGLVDLQAHAATLARVDGVAVTVVPRSDNPRVLDLSDGSEVDLGAIGEGDFAFTLARLGKSADPADQMIAKRLQNATPDQAALLERGLLTRFASAYQAGRKDREAAAAVQAKAPLNLFDGKTVDSLVAAELAHTRNDRERVGSYEAAAQRVFKLIDDDLRANPARWRVYDRDDVHPVVRQAWREWDSLRLRPESPSKYAYGRPEAARNVAAFARDYYQKNPVEFGKM